MLEALEYYQSLAQKFQGQLLIGLGITVVLAGLCIWLAGLRWRRIIGALAGAAVAAVGVFAAGNFAANVFLAACIIGLFAGIIVNRIVFGLLGAAVGALLVIVILTGGLTTVEREAPFVSTWPEYEQNNVVVDASAAMEITTKMAEFLAYSAKKTVASAKAVSYAGAGLAAVIAVVAALTAPRWLIAVISSSLGSTVIFIGMIMLLFYKGSKPISYIAQRPWFYATAFGAMLIFGTVVQLILSPPAAKQVKTNSADKDNGIKNKFRTF